MLKVNSQSLVRIDNHQYTVPTLYVGQAITAHVNGHTIRLMPASELIAQHPRNFKRNGVSMIHYIT